MGLMGIKLSTRKLGFKGKSAGPWGEGRQEKEDGVGICGHYDVELDEHGYCRDEECRYNRLIDALKKGEAMKTPDGTIVWTPGQKIRDV
jgi:hypothetical protein